LFKSLAIDNEVKTYMFIFTAFEWAAQFMKNSNKHTNLAVQRLTGHELLMGITDIPALNGGIIVNYNIIDTDCEAKNIIITKEEIDIIVQENKN